MLEENAQNMHNPPLSGDKRALPEPDLSLTPESTTAELISWLANVLRPKDIKKLDTKGFGASDLLLLESEEVWFVIRKFRRLLLWRRRSALASCAMAWTQKA